MPPPSRRARLGVLLVAAAALVLGLGADPAAAHAVPVSSTPSDGAALDEPPTSVTIEFSERVSVELGGLQVLDATGERVDRGAVEVVDRSISVGVTDDLPDGAYIASYRIVSADGHPITGGIVFTVGEGDADAAAGALAGLVDDGADQAWEVVGAVARWLAMVGALLVVGGVAFVTWCRPAAGASWASRLFAVGAVVGVAGMLAVVPVQAALATGQGLGSVLQDGVLSSVLGDGYGPAVALGVGGILVAVVAVGRSRSVALLASAAVLASFPLVGHTRVDDVVVGSLADVVHVGAAAVWTGGLVFLLAARRRLDDDSERVAVVGRFSDLATVAIVLVGLAGLALSWTEVRTLDALTSTDYGGTLLAKVAIVLLVGAAGLHNHFRLVPAAIADPGSAPVQRRMTRVLQAEVAGVALALAVTAVLVNVTPAYVDVGVGQVHSEILDLGDAGSVQLVVDPNRAGQNSMHLYFYDPAGRPAQIADDVRLELTKPGDGVGPISREPFRAGPAHFQWDGAELVSSGRWEITVVARIDRFSEETATADVLVG